MAEDVTLDDLQPIDWAGPPINDLITFCPRCYGCVPLLASAMTGHERWHAAIEDLTVTVQVEDGRLLTLDHGAVKLGGAGASAQPEHQPLRVQLIETLRGMAVKEWGQDATDLADQILRVVEPHMERQVEQYADRARDTEAHNLRLKGELVRQSDLVEELRKQVESLSQASQGQRRDLRAALGVGVGTTWSQMIRLVTDNRRYISERWTQPDPVTTVDMRLALPDGWEDQIRDAGTEEIIGLVRDWATHVCEAHCTRHDDEPRADRPAEAVSPTVAGIIPLLELAARGREAHAEESSPTRKMQLRHEAKAFREAIDVVASMLPEVGKLADSQLEPTGADFTPPAEGAELTPGQWIARFLSLDADARLEWAEHYQAEARRSADCFRMNHLRRLADADDYLKRVMAVVVRRANPDALDAHGGLLGFLDQELGWLATYRKSAVAEVERNQGASLGSVTISTGDDGSFDVADLADRLVQKAQELGFTATVHAPGGITATTEQPSEVCPSLCLCDGKLLACDGRKGHVPGHGNYEANIGWQYGDREEVPVPWPLDQEPPPGINVLRDTGEASAAYLCRVDDGWVWRRTPGSRGDNFRGEPWATTTLHADGDLHVVRPQ